uniref:Zinc finger protein SNAI2 n=1 Tax=Phallusia mammillata TaxID=59560 RepID=A0A6F9DTT1_9ASCI|nr:Snail [Phallusia mammillata]
MTSIESILLPRKFETKGIQDNSFPRDYISNGNDSFYSNSDSGASTSSPTSSLTSAGSGSGDSDEGVFLKKGVKYLGSLEADEPIDLSCHRRGKTENINFTKNIETTRSPPAPVLPMPFVYPSSLLQWPYLFPPATLGSMNPFAPVSASLFNPGLYSQHTSAAKIAASKQKSDDSTGVLSQFQAIMASQSGECLPSRDPSILADFAKVYKQGEKRRATSPVHHNKKQNEMTNFAMYHNLPTMVAPQFGNVIGGVKRRRQSDDQKEQAAPPSDKKLKQGNEKFSSTEHNQYTSDGLVRPQPVNFKPCRLPCDVCGRTYATIGALAKHAKTHEDPEAGSKFNCKICKKECTSLGALRMHIRTHTLPCECHICGKAFSRTWLLQGHIRTHTGEKPYECTVCSRAFADRSNLRAHMQTHETVKRYSCITCEKTFSRISLLKRHQTHCDVTKPQCDA